MKRFFNKIENVTSKKCCMTKTDIEDIDIEESIDDPSPSYKNNISVSPMFEKLSKHYLFDGKFYKIISTSENKLIAQCQFCSKTIHGQINSTGNFHSHIKVCINQRIP